VQNEPASQSVGEDRGVRNLRERPEQGPACVTDGPPYANGGSTWAPDEQETQDFVVRIRSMAGRTAVCAGWDATGAIEHKVQTELVEAGKYEEDQGAG